MSQPIQLSPRRLHGITKDVAESPLKGAAAYIAAKPGDCLEYTATPGTLSLDHWISCDLLVGGNHLAVFELHLHDGCQTFKCRFGLLNECQARLRLSLRATLQNAWMLQREAALLKPMCDGGMVDVTKIDRITLQLERHDGRPVRICVSPLTISAEEPAKLVDPLLTRGKLLDEIGQSTLHDWPGKTRSVGELVDRLRRQRADASTQQWPAGFSRWGGAGDLPAQPASGYFRTHHDGRRWWLIDPDGHPFFSAGLDCVRPSIDSNVAGLESAIPSGTPIGSGTFGWGRTADFLKANLRRAFGEEYFADWTQITLGHLRQWGFNTIGNWSDHAIGTAARFPYVRPMTLKLTTPMIFRDFPDVFAPGFDQDCARFAEQLEETKSDPAMIGYFLMNEPTWGFASQTPAEGMLINAERCATRDAFAQQLRRKYAGDAALSAAWGDGVTFDRLARGRWIGPFSEAATADCREFSVRMIDRLMRGLSDACKRVDPNHLNLGARYYTAPPEWMLRGMACFDVFSINGYDQKLRAEKINSITSVVDRPILVGEWHHGALDVGLPASGIGHVKTQADRGRAFRYYTEQSAALPACVGVHYFILYDQSALGRFDGENYNIGFLDIAHRPYDEIARAARQSHERLYDVAAGKLAPYNDPPDYLPMLFM